MTEDDLAIPAFLRRVGGPSAPGPTARPADGTRDWIMPAASDSLSAATKGRIAAAVISAVEGGADTFGKIRHALGNRYTDRELRAGIRTARGWQPRLKPGTSGGRPVMRRRRVALVLTGRRYSIIER